MVLTTALSLQSCSTKLGIAYHVVIVNENRARARRVPGMRATSELGDTALATVSIAMTKYLIETPSWRKGLFDRMV